MQEITVEAQLTALKKLVDWQDSDLIEMQDAIKQITTYRPLEFTNESFLQAQHLWLALISRIPLGFIELNVRYIVRAREVEDEIFSEQHQITYPQQTRLGRFSFPNAPVFYGAVPTDDNQRFLATGMLEACKDATNDECQRPYFDLCIGRWRLNQPFYVMNLCLDEVHLSRNPRLKSSIEYQLELLKSVTRQENYRLVCDFWALLSYYATAKNPDEIHYFISSALFATIRSYYEHTMKQRINGILYPSAMTDKEGLNIAIVPEAVDEFLTLQDVVIYRVRRLADPKAYNMFPYSDIAEVIDGKFSFARLQEMFNEDDIIQESKKMKQRNK